jgi:hypothetical protein
MWCCAVPLVAVLLGRAGQAPPAPALSAAEAQSLADKLAAIERRVQAGKPPRKEPVTVSEGELNSYLNLTLAPKLPKGLSDVVVHFDRDRLQGRGLLDLDLVQGRVPTAGGLGAMMGLLSGRVPVEAGGKLKSAEAGFGIFEIDSLHLSTFPVPMNLLEQLVASATRSPDYPEGFDIRSPFRLPYSLKRIRLEPGRALLEF